MAKQIRRRSSAANTLACRTICSIFTTTQSRRRGGRLVWGNGRERATATSAKDDVLSFQPNPEGRPIKAVLDVDGAAFRETWLSAVEAAGR